MTVLDPVIFWVFEPSLSSFSQSCMWSYDIPSYETVVRGIRILYTQWHIARGCTLSLSYITNYGCLFSLLLACATGLFIPLGVSDTAVLWRGCNVNDEISLMSVCLDKNILGMIVSHCWLSFDLLISTTNKQFWNQTGTKQLWTSDQKRA